MTLGGEGEVRKHLAHPPHTPLCPRRVPTPFPRCVSPTRGRGGSHPPPHPPQEFPPLPALRWGHGLGEGGTEGIQTGGSQ